MNDFFPLFSKRDTTVLDGLWDFCWLGDVQDKTIKPSKLDYNELSPVPGTFDSSVKRYNARGVAVYKRTVHCSAGLKRLEIGGLGLYGKVFWDGVALGECTGPYTSYAFDFETKAGEHALQILLDNRFSEEHPTLFHNYADFYAFGGIYRSVLLRSLPKKRLERTAVKTLDLETGKVELTFLTAGFPNGKTTLDIAFDSRAAVSRTVNIQDNQAVIQLRVPHFKIWTPESPNLHTVTVSSANDAVTERFGIRKVCTRGQKVLLNGKPIRFCGVNRHESHPELGPLAQTQLMFDDLMHVKNLGANFIRCVHYTQDPIFLDMCDQVGILIWEESLGWNNPDDDAKIPALRNAAIQDTAAMVRRDINHPSIIFWGFLNESCSNTETGRLWYQDITNAIRAEDSTRLVTFASNKSTSELCFDFADVMCTNLYPGWIDCRWDEECNSRVKPCLDDFAQWASTGGREKKPLIVSEIGACGILGTHDYGQAQWTEEFQAEFFKVACEAVLNNPRYAGIALWQMFDTRSYVGSGSVRTKPFGLNLAGLLDPYRRPKLAYATVREIFRRQLGLA